MGLKRQQLALRLLLVLLAVLPVVVSQLQFFDMAGCNSLLPMNGRPLTSQLLGKAINQPANVIKCICNGSSYQVSLSLSDYKYNN